MRKHLTCIFLILLICILSTSVNRLPAEYIVSGSDFPYILDVSNHMKDLLYVWSDVGSGMGSPDRPNSVTFPYFVSHILTLLGFSDTQILNLKFFNFIFLSAISIYLSCCLLANFKVKPLICFIVALFYAFNTFTIYGFSASWMYHPYFDIHITLPLIWVLFTRGLTDNNKVYLSASIITMLFSLSAFSNPVFLLTLFIFLMLSTILLMLIGMIDKKQILLAFSVLLAYIMVIAFYILPTGYEYLYGSGFGIKVASGSVAEWIEKVSSKVIHSIRLANDNPQLFFPNSFPYGESFKSIFIFLSFYPGIFAVLALLFVKGKNKKIVLIFASLLLIFVYIAVKTNMPLLGNIGVLLFTLPIIEGIRTPDKTYPFIVFIYSVLLLYLLREVSNNREAYRPKLQGFAYAACLVVVLVYPLPFFIGKFQQNVTMDRGSTYSHLVKVPSAYKKLADFMAKDKDDYKILHMPYGGVPMGYEATLWNYYPKWKFLGSDTTRYYFTRPVIHPSNPIGEFYYGNYLYKHPYELDTFANLLKILGVRYVVSDRNTDVKYMGAFGQTLSRNSADRYLDMVKSFDNLDLYRLRGETPLIYSSLDTFMVIGNTRVLSILANPIYFNSYPAFVFTEQQNKDSLITAIGDGQRAKGERPNNSQILFANSNFNDLIIDLAKAESQSENQKLEAISQKPVFAKLNSKGRAKIKIKEAGIYEIWVKIDDKFIKEIDAMKIGGETYPIEKENINGRWLKIGVKEFKEGKQKVELISKEKEAKNLQTDVVIISEEKRKEYEEILKSKEMSYLSYKEEDDSSGSHVSKAIGKKDFYISKSGEYEVKALIKPKREKIRAYAINEDFENGMSMDWNLRVPDSRQSAVGSQRIKIQAKGEMPVFVFGNNFYPPQTMSYPLMDGMWRWMSNNGKVLIFNPFNAPVNVNISFSVVSFKDKRDVKLFLNNDQIQVLSLSGAEEKIDKRGLKEISDIAQLSKGSGKPQKIELGAVVLKPGINEMLLESIPSAAQIGKDDRFLVSIAISDDFRVMLSDRLSEAGLWGNKKGFDGRVEDGQLVLTDNYMGQKEDAAWVTRKLPNIDLYDNPLFVLKYSWSDNQAQSMDIGFRIDTNGDGKEDIYFTRTLPETDRFEIDLLEEVWKIFPDTLTGKVFLAGVDLFPHKKWGLDVSRNGKEGIYKYQLKGAQSASKEASVVVVDEDRFKGFKFAEGMNYSMGRENKDLTVPMPLGGRKGGYRSAEFSMPIKQGLPKNYFVLAPFRVSDEGVQSISAWLGYDTSGDEKADEFVPLGKKVFLSNWKLIAEDIKKSMFSSYIEIITKNIKKPTYLYETKLPSDLSVEYTTRGKRFDNIIVLKDGKPLEPTWNNEFRTAKEQVQVDEGKVLINLPEDMDPDNFRYELFYMPKGWIKDSSGFPGYKEYAIEIGELKDILTDSAARPVEIKFILQGRTAEYLENEKFYNFYFKAPMYSYTVFPRLDNIQIEPNMPVMTLDDEMIEFKEQRVDKEKDRLWLTARVSFEQGEHQLTVRDKGALEAEMMEVKPVNSEQLTVNSQTPKIEFKKINPTRYIVDVKGAKGPFTLVFSESFHDGWKAYVRQWQGDRDKGQEKEPWSALWSAWEDRGNRVEIKDHFVVNGYANGWIVPAGQFRVKGKNGEDFEIVLEYKPQRLFEMGLLISGATLLGCVGYLGFGFMRRRKKSN